MGKQKILSDEAVFMGSIDELKETIAKYHQLQKISFICSECGKQSTKRLLNIKSYPFLVCRVCKGEKTNLEKYGYTNPFKSKEV